MVLQENQLFSGHSKQKQKNQQRWAILDVQENVNIVGKNHANTRNNHGISSLYIRITVWSAKALPRMDVGTY